MPDEPVVQTPPAPPAAQVQPGPWEQDIRQAFADPQEAARVDAFLRSRVQPRVTQLEQERAAAREAQELWDAFHKDPEGTFRAIQSQLVDAGYSVGEAQRLAGETATAVAAAPSPTQTASAAAEDPRVAEMYADWTHQRELSAYDASIAGIVNDPANTDIDPNRLHTFVAAADGDFQRALDLYRADIADVLVRYGLDPATATPQQTDAAAAIAEGQHAAPGAPPVMGQGAGGAGASPPTQPTYQGQEGLHKAIDDAAAQMFRNKQDAPAVS